VSFFDPFGQPYRGRHPYRRQPTIEDYYQAVQAFQEATAENKRLAQLLHQAEATIATQKKQIARLEQELAQTQAALERLEQEAREPKQAIQVKLASSKEAETEWKERYLRLQADLDNYKRRLEQRYANEADEQRRRILTDMLSLADHLEMALEHTQNTQQEGAEKALQNLQANLEATLRAFLDTLKRYGVERIEATGQPFDPNYHEAIGQIPSAEVPEDHVAQVVRPGYMEHDRLLRPARVLVSRGGE
jgi:molecular chaperone GrpE